MTYNGATKFKFFKAIFPNLFNKISYRQLNKSRIIKKHQNELL